MTQLSSSATPSYAPHGVGLRMPHLDEIMVKRPAVDFFEVHPENYFLDVVGLTKLELLRSDYALSLHAVGLSLGSVSGIDPGHLATLRELVDRLDPFLISDHLSWSVVDGVFLNDLLPIPYTREALEVVVRNIDKVQSALGRMILIENPSSYISFHESELSETEFLRAITRQTGCGLLLDVNNVFVSAKNLDFEAEDYLANVPLEEVREIHLAGHARKEINGKTVLIDDHGAPVPKAVWALYDELVSKLNSAATLVEWDSNIPPLKILLDQSDQARARARRGSKRPQAVTPLATLQREMKAALLVQTDGPAVFDGSGYFSIHRNNVRESLTEALRTVYRGVEALVGEAFFRQTAHRFIEVSPPRAPVIAGYGDGFADFLDSLASCWSLPYLGDVARLEWNASRVCLVSWTVSLSPEILRGFISRDAARLCFSTQPALSYLATDYPIDEIWLYACGGGKGAAPVMEGGAAYLEIAQAEGGLLLRRLDDATFCFRHRLAAGADLEAAASAAIQRDPLFDLPAALRFALRDGIFTACQFIQMPFEEVRPCQHSQIGARFRAS